MSNIPKLFQEPEPEEPPRKSYLSPGTLFLVVYVSERDTHIQSIHQEKDAAVQVMEDNAVLMRKHRLKYFSMGTAPECYLVVECPVVAVVRV